MLRTNYVEVFAASSMLTSTAHRIDETLAQQLREMNRLFADGWTGEAATKCQEAHARSMAGAQQINAALARVGATLKTNAENTHNTDSSIAY